MKFQRTNHAFERAVILLAIVASSTLFQFCGEKKVDSANGAVPKKEIPQYGRIKHVDIGPIDQSMLKEGSEVFEMKCTACHKMEERYVGPALGDVSIRRTPEYIMNMILDTETMIEKDDTVKCLLQTYMLKMPNQSVDEKDARKVLEHFRHYAETKKK